MSLPGFTFFSFLLWYHNAVRKVFKGVHGNLSMRKDFASVVVLCFALAVCIVAIRLKSPQPGTEETADERVVFKDVSDIVSITVDVVPENWDADPEKDGFMLYITFYDERDTIIAFKDTEYSIRIKIFKADSNGTVKGELLYDLCCPPVKKTSSSEVRKPHGVKMFMTFSDDVEWVTVEVEVEIPGVGTFSDADEGVPVL